MKTVISVRDLETMLHQGADPRALPADALLTPSARDFLRDWQAKGARAGLSNGAPKSPVPAGPITSQSPKQDLEAFFHAPEIHQLKLDICEMGRRLWERAYVDGNGGNIAIKVAEDVVLCTPTLVSKGFMKPEDMCLVDMEDNQLAGPKKRTSEILMHLQMMQRQPQIKASVHCHPPYATAFAIAGIAPPTCMIPEFEVFCAVALAPYRTPGTPEMGKLVADLVDQHNTILMANHGVVTWSHQSVEEAYWRMEIIEAYCRTLVVAAHLGKPLNAFSGSQLQDLLKTKQSLGFVDPRFGLKECELCDSNEWRTGATCEVPASADGTAHTADPAALDPDAEALVKAIADQIMAGMK